MRLILVAFSLVSLMLVGCGTEGTDSSSTEVSGYQLTMRTSFSIDADDHVSFMNPSGSPITLPADFYRGKPWVGLTFEAGAEAGVDEPIDMEWGTVPDSLQFEYTPDSRFPEGPYDLVVIVYGGTPISTEIIEGDVFDLPFPSGNDVSTFTADRSMVREGDPDFNGAGMIRVNVDGEDTVVEVSNRVSTQDDDIEVRRASFANTFLIVP